MIDPRQPEPTSVTAFIAGVLAFLGGIVILCELPVFLSFGLADIGDPSMFLNKLEELLLGASGLLLVVGGIRMLRKKTARILLGTGSIGILAISVITIPACGYGRECDGVTAAQHSVSATVDFDQWSSLGVAFSITVLVLTYLPSISHWLAHRLIPRRAPLN